MIFSINKIFFITLRTDLFRDFATFSVRQNLQILHLHAHLPAVFRQSASSFLFYLWPEHWFLKSYIGQAFHRHILLLRLLISNKDLSRLHKSLVLKNPDGTVADAYSIASGLDYPSVGPKHSHLHAIGRADYVTVDDQQAIDAFYRLSRTEGIIPALESSHAVAYALKLSQTVKNKHILVNLSGRGDKDIDFIIKNFPQP